VGFLFRPLETNSKWGQLGSGPFDELSGGAPRGVAGKRLEKAGMDSNLGSPFVTSRHMWRVELASLGADWPPSELGLEVPAWR